MKKKKKIKILKSSIFSLLLSFCFCVPFLVHKNNVKAETNITDLTNTEWIINETLVLNENLGQNESKSFSITGIYNSFDSSSNLIELPISSITSYRYGNISTIQINCPEDISPYTFNTYYVQNSSNSLTGDIRVSYTTLHSLRYYGSSNRNYEKLRTFTITGGNDITNQELISLISTNATQINIPEEPDPEPNNYNLTLNCSDEFELFGNDLQISFDSENYEYLLDNYSLPFTFIDKEYIEFRNYGSDYKYLIYEDNNLLSTLFSDDVYVYTLSSDSLLYLDVVPSSYYNVKFLEYENSLSVDTFSDFKVKFNDSSDFENLRLGNYNEIYSLQFANTSDSAESLYLYVYRIVDDKYVLVCGLSSGQTSDVIDVTSNSNYYINISQSVVAEYPISGFFRFNNLIEYTDIDFSLEFYDYSQTYNYTGISFVSNDSILRLTYLGPSVSQNVLAYSNNWQSDYYQYIYIPYQEVSQEIYNYLYNNGRFISNEQLPDNDDPVPTPPGEIYNGLTNFLLDSVENFLQFELVPGFSLYYLLSLFISVPLLIVVLKLFLGG